MKNINRFGIVALLLITILSVFVSGGWTESTEYLSTPMTTQNVGSQYSFVYGLNGQCLTYGDSAISYRYGVCWDGDSWETNNTIKLPSTTYQQYQGFGGIFNLSDNEVIITAIKYNDGTNKYEIRAYENDGSMTVSPEYKVGLPNSSITQYDTIVSVPIEDTQNLIFLQNTGTIQGYTWNGSLWEINDTIENNFKTAIHFENYLFAEMTPQIVNGVTYIIYNKDRDKFYSMYWNGTGWVEDSNHVEDLNTLVPYLDTVSHSARTQTGFYKDDGTYVLLDFYIYDMSRYYRFWEYTLSSTNDAPQINLTYINESEFYPNESIIINGTASDDSNLTSLVINSDSFYNNGNISNFEFINNETLSVGNHDYIIYATDGEGENTSINIRVVILDYPTYLPSMQVNNNSIFKTNQLINIHGNITDDGYINNLTINDSRFTNNLNYTNFEFISNETFNVGNYTFLIQVTDDNDRILNTSINFEVEQFYNTVPSAPTQINGIPLNLFANYTLNVVAIGSLDYDSDNITYYYKFYDNSNDSILQDYSTNNIFSLNDSHIDINLRIYAKAFDGTGYSSEIYISKNVQDYHFNTAPTTPTNIIFNNTNVFSNESLSFYANGSSDIDDDNLTYYYKILLESTIIQEYDLNNELNLNESFRNKNLYIYVKAFDGASYSSEYFDSIYIKSDYVKPPIEYINDTEAFKLGVCPTTEQGYKNMWYIIGIIFIMGMFAVIYKIIGLIIGSGTLLIFMSLSVMTCGYFLGVVIIGFGIGFIITGLSIR